MHLMHLTYYRHISTVFTMFVYQENLVSMGGKIPELCPVRLRDSKPEQSDEIKNHSYNSITL